MKFGQLLSFIMEALPDDAQKALAALQADAPPMSPAPGREVVTDELGQPPERVFLDWQVGPDRRSQRRSGASRRHARRSRGRCQGAVPGRRRRRSMPTSTTPRPCTDSARHSSSRDSTPRVWSTSCATRMRDELDYELEAAQPDASSPTTSPTIRSSSIPAVDPATSTKRVLTTEWVDGLSWAEFLDDRRRRRRANAPANRSGASRSTPCIASVRSTATRTPATTGSASDGEVTFLDFGLVKRWTPGEWEQLAPSLDAIIVHRDPERLVAAMEDVGFLRAGHGLAAARRVRLRQHAVRAVPHRHVHVHPRRSCATRWQRSSTSRARTPR